MRALSLFLLLGAVPGVASATKPSVVATPPAPPTSRPAPSLVKGFRYGPIGAGAAMIRWQDQTFFTSTFQLRGDLVFRSGLAVGAEVRFAIGSGRDDDDTPSVVSLLAVTSRDVGRVRFHAGVGPGWVKRGPVARSSPGGSASIGADLSIARAGRPAPTLWLTSRADAVTSGVFVASLGLRVDLDFFDP